MNKKRRISLLFLVFFIVFGAFAGGGQQGNAPSTGVTVPAGTPGVVSYPVTGNPKVTLAMELNRDIQTAGYSSFNDTPGVKAWNRQTGITVDFLEMADTNAFMVYLAAGNSPDIVKGAKDFYPGGIPKMVEDGLTQDLTAALPVYAPDYWKFINSDPRYYKAIQEPDGKHYAFAGYFLQPGNINGSWTGLVGRQEFFDQLKISAPQTIDELYTYLRRSKDELGCEVPFMTADYRFAMIFSGGSLTSPFGLPTADTYQLNGTVHYGSYDPAYKDVLAFMNRLYTEKLLDNNFAVTDEPTANASVLNGKTSLILTAASRIQNMTVAAQNSPDFTLVGLPSMSTAKGVTPMFSYADGFVATSDWAFIPQKSHDLPNALKALNYLYTEKGNILANFGEEGVTFNYVNGNPVFNDYVANNPQGLPVDGVLRANALLNFPIVMDNRMTLQRFPLKQQVQAMQAWSNSDGDKYRIVNTSIIGQNASEYAGLVTDINTYINESRAQFISGALPLASFDQYIANLRKMGMDRLLEILQASYNMYNK